MRLTTGIQATLKRDPVGDLADQDVLTALFAAFPPLWGHGGVEVEHVDGPTWLVTVPSAFWNQIEGIGHFERRVKLGDGTGVTLTIEAPDTDYEDFDGDEDWDGTTRADKLI